MGSICVSTLCEASGTPSISCRLDALAPGRHLDGIVNQGCQRLLHCRRSSEEV